LKKAIKRGEVYWINFGSPIGDRPALIVQNDIGNKFAPTVIIAPITSTPSDKSYPTDVLLPDGILPKKNSRVLTSTILTIVKEDIGDYLTTLPEEIMEKVDLALMVSLDLEKYIKQESAK